MNFKLENYEISRIEIKKGSSYAKDDVDCRWYDVSLNIKNKYFNYNETRECLLERELWEIYHTLNKCLNNELDENKNLWFVEPDLELEFSCSSDENHIHLVDFQIYVNLEGIAGGDYYSFLLDEEQMIMFRDYLEKILKAKKINGGE